MNVAAGAPARASAVATSLLALDTALWAVHLAIRPPCPANYVRLLDVSPAVPFLAGLLALLAGGLWFGNRHDDSPRLGIDGWVAVGLSAAGLALLVVGLGVLGKDGQSPATNCWTF